MWRGVARHLLRNQRFSRAGSGEGGLGATYSPHRAAAGSRSGAGVKSTAPPPPRPRSAPARPHPSAGEERQGQPGQDQRATGTRAGAGERSHDGDGALRRRARPAAARPRPLRARGSTTQTSPARSRWSSNQPGDSSRILEEAAPSRRRAAAHAASEPDPAWAEAPARARDARSRQLLQKQPRTHALVPESFTIHLAWFHKERLVAAAAALRPAALRSGSGPALLPPNPER